MQPTRAYAIPTSTSHQSQSAKSCCCALAQASSRNVVTWKTTCSSMSQSVSSHTHVRLHPAVSYIITAQVSDCTDFHAAFAHLLSTLSHCKCELCLDCQVWAHIALCCHLDNAKALVVLGYLNLHHLKRSRAARGGRSTDNTQQAPHHS